MFFTCEAVDVKGSTSFGGNLSMICKMRASFKTLQEIEENLLAIPVGLLQGLDDQGRGRGAHCDLLGLTTMILLLFVFPLLAAFTRVAC